MTAVGAAYPPSVSPFNSFQKINIRQLELETHHRGSYPLVGNVCQGTRMQAVITTVEDEAGDGLPFSLYQQEPQSVRPASSILKKDGVFIIKEPYFKVVGIGGYAIRVDHPTDVIWLADNDTRMSLQWKANSASEVNSAEHWKLGGNKFVRTGEYYDAIVL